MNHLKIGLGEKHFDTGRGFLLIHDDVTVEADVFDPTIHSFNPLRKLDERGAVEFTETIYGSEGQDTLTVRNGKRALQRLLINTTRLDKLPFDADEEAKAVIDDLLFLPVVRRVLCREPNFSFRNRPIVARLNRSEIGERAAFVIGCLLIRQFKGQIIIPDFGFYARPFHMQLIREGRLMAGLNTLSEIEDKRLRDALLLMDKEGRGCTFDDAVVLANYAGLRPDPTREDNPYDRFIREAMS